MGKWNKISYKPQDKIPKLVEGDICYGCCHHDDETGMCASHEGCIGADDKNIDDM